MLAVDFSGQVVFSGAVTGLTYGVMAVGVILVFRSARVINFAVAEMGGFSAALLYRLVIDWDAPFWLSFVACIAVGAVIGAAIELLIVRRLFSAPRVILLVALIGAAQVLLFFQFILPDITQVRPYPTAFSHSWEIGGILVRSQELTVFAVIPALVALLALFLNRTKYGLAIRASAANADAARLAGINIKKTSTIVWVLSGSLASIAAMLFAPLNPQGVSALGVGPGMLLRVLTAALIGGMASLSLALAGGMAIGIAESLISYNFNGQRGLLDALLFVVVLVALLVGGRRRALAEADSGRWSFAPRIRPIPGAIAHRWWIRRLPALGALFVALVALFPLVFVDLPSQREGWSRVLLYAMVALSLTVLTGWAGQLSLGQFAFVGLGGMTTAALVRGGVGFVPALLAAGVIVALVAIVIGMPALRRPGLYLAITTFAFAVMTSSWLLWRNVFLDGEVAAELPRQVIPLPAALFDQGLDLRAQGSYYVVSLLALGLVLFGVARLQRSRLGQSMIAVRDNERAAASLGISPTRVKLTAFAIGGWIAGVAGGLLVGLVTRAQPSTFAATQSLRLISIVVIGGLSSVGGAVLGAFWVIGLPQLFDDSVEIGLLTSGAGLLILLLYFPGGLVQVLYNIRDALFAALARRVKAPADVPVQTSRPIPRQMAIATKGMPDDLTTVVDARAVTVSFDERTVVDHVGLHIGRGEVVGLIGANGAGKSTLMNAICGFVPSAGDVEILGHRATRLSAARRARLGLGRSFQGAELFQDLTVRDTVSLAMPGVRPWQRATRAEADEIIAFLGLGQFAGAFNNELSTGTRRIVELACILASGARVLCLDEPTAGIAQRESEAFGPLILRIREELGASLLVIEHDMPVIMGISDRVYCLEAGRMICEGTPEAVRTDPLVVASYLGTDEQAIQRSGAAPSTT
ncbi:MAG TPA: ATP-binding cassette domain-containing protein [Acidimicrobiia bacterium]|nr:ATP-binding cassette domain-containing protein [Acidimicrobiia bacterium]